MMNKDIIEILEKSEEIKFEVKSTEDYKYYFIKGLYGKVFLLCEERKNLEDTLKIVEKLCISDEVLKDMWPQFIYVIIMKQVNQVNNQTLKEIISVEENEYFCKKYVLYYEKKEIDALKEWMNKENEYKLGNMINLDDCVRYMNEEEKKEVEEEEDKKEEGDKKGKYAVKMLLRLLIKCPFVQYRFDKKVFEDFDAELDSKLKGIRKIDKKRMMEYKEIFFDKLEPDNIENMVDLFIQSVRKEEKKDVI